MAIAAVDHQLRAAASSGVYAAQSVDVGTVPLYATYTVTFYDSNGAKLGVSQMMNPGSPLGAAAGATVSWPSLLSDFETQFLTPAGSLAGIQCDERQLVQPRQRAEPRVSGEFGADSGIRSDLGRHERRSRRLCSGHAE